MAQGMSGNPLFNPRFQDVVMQCGAESSGDKAVSSDGEKHIFVSRIIAIERPDFIKIQLEEPFGLFCDGYNPVFRTFALDEKVGAFKVEVVEFKGTKFRASDSASVEYFKDGPVAKPDRMFYIRLSEQELHFLDGKDVFRKRAFNAFQRNIAGGVYEDHIIIFKEGKPEAEETCLSPAVAVAEGLSVFLAVVFEGKDEFLNMFCFNVRNVPDGRGAPQRFEEREKVIEESVKPQDCGPAQVPFSEVFDELFPCDVNGFIHDFPPACSLEILSLLDGMPGACV